jgi:DNA-binding CsgD family transcriptional regulator
MLVTADPEFITDEERRRHPLYQEFLEPSGCHYVSGAVLEATSDLRIVASVCHTKTQGPPQTSQRELFAALLPRLRSAALLQARLENQAAAVALGVLQSVGIAVILCDFAGRIVGFSEAGERILLEGRVLTQRAGRLRAISPASERALSAALDRAASLTSLFTPRSSAVLLRDAEGVAAKVADVTPLPSSSNSLRIGGRLLVTIGVPKLRARGVWEELGLTEAEADVARSLVTGASLRDIAAGRAVSVETVRAQLKSVFAKLGVRRQTELLKRLRDLT